MESSKREYPLGVLSLARKPISECLADLVIVGDIDITYDRDPRIFD